jgi:TM2 domain-containing membrane protein YozV
MVSLKLDKYKLWGLITIAVTWILYMVALGTPWYQVRKLPKSDSTGSGDNWGFTVKFEILRLVYDQVDYLGHTQHSSVSWNTYNLVWTRSIFSGSYAMCVLSFVFMTIILGALLLTILGSGSAMFGKAAKGLAIAVAVFHTISILIFAGITLAFKKDQNNAINDDPNKMFWPCQNQCADSFVGLQNADDDTYLWAPHAGWAIMVITWPIMVAAAYLVTRKVDFGGEGGSSSSSSSNGKGVTIELPQSN